MFPQNKVSATQTVLTESSMMQKLTQQLFKMDFNIFRPQFESLIRWFFFCGGHLSVVWSK